MPQGLRAAVAALALCLPLSALQNVLMRHAPWWRLPYPSIALACLPVLLFCALIAWLLTRGRPVGYPIAMALGAIWFLSAGWSAIRLHNTSLGFFTLLLGTLLLSFLAWLKVELGRSFFDPRMRWYEGLPQPIPGVGCELVSESGKAMYRVSRLDREGAFLFRGSCEAIAETSFRPNETEELLFSFRDRQIRCAGVPIRRLHRMGGQNGVGIQFRGMSPDARKLLGDFVEALKGEGYVS